LQLVISLSEQQWGRAPLDLTKEEIVSAHSHTDFFCPPSSLAS